MAASYCAVGTFDLRTSTGTQDISLPAGFGQATAIEFWVTNVYESGGGDDTDFNHGRFSYGACSLNCLSDPTPVQAYASVLSTDNLGTTQAKARSGEDGVMSAETGAGAQALLVEMSDVTDWPTDGFQINVVTHTFGVNFKVNYRAWGGGTRSTLNRLLVGTTAQYVTTGFTPRAMTFFGCARTIGAFNGSRISVGFSTWDDSTITQVCMADQDQDGVGTSAGSGIVSNAVCYAVLTPTAADFTAQVSGADDNGYQILQLTGALPGQFYGLCLGFPDGEQALCGIVSAPTSTGTSGVTTNFQPQTAMVLGNRALALNSVVTNGTAGTGFSIGAFQHSVLDSERFGEYYHKDGAGTSDTKSRTGDGVVYLHDNSAAAEWVSVFDSVSSTSFVLNWTTVGSSTSFMPYMAVEQFIFSGSAPSIVAPFPTATASGGLTLSGAIAANAPFPSVCASGSLEFQGAAAATAPFPTCSASGSLTLAPHTGAIVAIAPFPLASACGREEFRGDAQAVAPFPTCSASGSLTLAPHTGAIVAIAPFPSAAVSGRLEFRVVVSATAPFPTCSASGNLVFSGAIAAVAPFPTCSAIGVEVFIGAVAAVALFPSASASGSEVFSGVIIAIAPFPAASGAGGQTISGAIAAVAPFPTCSAVGATDSPPVDACLEVDLDAEYDAEVDLDAEYSSEVDLVAELAGETDLDATYEAETDLDAELNGEADLVAECG